MQANATVTVPPTASLGETLPGLPLTTFCFPPTTPVLLTVTSRRLLKAAEAIREVVASSILTEMRDPRVQDVTVVAVKVSPDMREAVVNVSIMGDAKQQQLSLRGLQNAAGFLQSRIAQRIDTRYTPRLQFKIDKGIQHSLEVGDILAKIEREREPASDSQLDESDDNVSKTDSPDAQEGNQPEVLSPRNIEHDHE